MFPADRFGQIAADLEDYARNQAIALEGCEIFLARAERRDLIDLDEIRRQAVSAGVLAAAFRAMEPFEAQIRALMEDLVKHEALQ